LSVVAIFIFIFVLIVDHPNWTTIES
jgi:hypothetical protein